MSAVREAKLVLPIPDFTLPLDDRFELGDRIRFSHRAAVVRWRKNDYGDGGMWLVTEGLPKRAAWRPPIDPDPETPKVGFGLLSEPDDWYSRPRADGTNKSILVWPETGEGLVFGLVRRGFGESVPARGSTTWFEDNYEPGYFATDGFAWLYAVKSELDGLDYALVPPWAAEAL